MHESLQGATFHVEHIIPQCKGGGSDLENLALECPGCNLHKASRITAVNPETGEDVRLFTPSCNFGPNTFGLTAIKSKD
jgi:5-methylcytosine-specific restriction endonuclease McrA